jgi:uncharacterized membrane protein (UPF0127 family)
MAMGEEEAAALTATDAVAALAAREAAALRRSEERYRSLYERAPVPLHSLDGDGRVVRAVHTLQPFRAARALRGAVQVVELPAGTLGRTGTREGDELAFDV